MTLKLFEMNRCRSRGLSEERCVGGVGVGGGGGEEKGLASVKTTREVRAKSGRISTDFILPSNTKIPR